VALFVVISTSAVGVVENTWDGRDGDTSISRRAKCPSPGLVFPAPTRHFLKLFDPLRGVPLRQARIECDTRLFAKRLQVRGLGS
jgi:hypothetical protein